MLSFFRNFFKSKLGLAITLGFLVLIALAFASADVSSTNTFGGVAGGDRVAVVGDARISTAELSRAATQALDRARQQDPTLSMPAFIAQGGLDEVLNSMIDRAAIAEYARRHGFRAGDDLINSEIRKIGAFRGPDGNFSAEVYKNALAQQGLTDKLVREDLGKGLLAQLLLEPASIGVRYPGAAANRYALLFKERRIGSVGFLPSAAFAPTSEPDAQTLERYYQSARARFIRPERRVIRYAEFGPEAVADRIAPTAAQIAERYKQDAVKYSARETRTLTELVLPTQQAAEAIAKRVAGGTTLEAAAAAAGLRTSPINELAKPEIASRMSNAVADAFFAAPEGGLSKPARDSLGWHLARVDKVTRSSGKTLAEATPEITEALTISNRDRALADLAAGVEQQLDEGATLPEAASTLKVAPQTTAPVLATGQGYDGGAAVPEELAPVLATAFQMEESSPQVAQLGQGNRFVVFEVTRITPSAAAPLAEIRADVVAAWRQDEGAKAARAAADKVLAAVKGGTPLGAAMASAKPGLPAPEQVNLSREELANRQQRVPPPLALMFSMAQGATKRLEGPMDSGWYVVDLDRIELGKLEPNDPLGQQARRELSQAFTAELTQQAVAAIRAELGVEINRAAVDAVRQQLTGGN